MVRERFAEGEGEGVPRHDLTLPFLILSGRTQSSASRTTLDIGESKQAVTIAG